MGALLQKLGGEVRRLREARGLTLRELSERSTVSLRFLSLLEKGDANISIERLVHVADALGVRGSELLLACEGQASTSEAREIRTVALLGLRGAGKTAIGKQVATRVGLPFVELDSLIAERAGISLEAIFTLHGPDYYRRLELAAVLELAARDRPVVLATGGGIVAHHAAFERLRGFATTVFLRATAQDHWDRVVAQGDVRPMANRESAMQELHAILRARRALYERAHHVVDTSALGLDESVLRVVELVRRGGKSPEF